MPSQSLLQLGAVILHPAPDRGVVDIETTLLQQLLNIAQRKRIAKIPVWSKISSALKRLGFRSHSFLVHLLSETSRACTTRVRRSSLGRLWNDLGSHACVDHRNRRPGTRGAQSTRASRTGSSSPCRIEGRAGITELCVARNGWVVCSSTMSGKRHEPSVGETPLPWKRR